MLPYKIACFVALAKDLHTSNPAQASPAPWLASFGADCATGSPELYKTRNAKWRSSSSSRSRGSRGSQPRTTTKATRAAASLTSIYRHMANAINSHHNWKLAMVATATTTATTSKANHLCSSLNYCSPLPPKLAGSCHSSLARHNHTLLRQCLL